MGTERREAGGWKPAGTGPGVLGCFPGGTRTHGGLEAAFQEKFHTEWKYLGRSKSGQGSQEVGHGHFVSDPDLWQQCPASMKGVEKASKR